MKLMQERNELSVVDDQTGSPTYAADLAEVILQIISNWQPGIYHFSNDGVITWFDFANEIKKITDSKTKINPVSTAEYPTPAKRPAYSVLNKSKLQHTFHVELKDWKQSLVRCISKM